MKTGILFAVVILCSLTDVSVGCDVFQVSGGYIQNTQLNTTVHVPLATTKCSHLTQCIQDGLRVKTCNKINFAPATGTCHFFDISGSETIVDSPITEWKAVHLSDVTGSPPNFCTLNTCSAGESCFDGGNGPICTET
ncbi:uncharacterized protein LOC123528083 [Mercenaria mercenaria]|uniref:uncharacterized protein LOC123528083 n=1 Tax=Mercenaria mercenaria TaxID=6596 RepID=UPI001E1E0252|nr:uncharacterized protein LOC123528083 [Mercenaria mercenaria]